MEWSNWNEHNIAQCPSTLTVENVREVVASGEGGELVWCPTFKVNKIDQLKGRSLVLGE